ncbi:NUDIX hydrolase N-terminal domain-containing protein [Ktedonobacteria bacterium brp13]|nr:NUDIX hydrolase N-terminal domain-containing protein [Ktedonobacteria bacterium brp13]
MASHSDNTKDTADTMLAQKLALYADILRDCSAAGLHYADNIYDQDRYKRIQDVAIELLALATTKPLEELEPLRATLFTRTAPLPSGDGAVIDTAGRILLIRRSDNALWAMPGGALEVGETSAQGVVREVLEETGVACNAIALVGVHDSRFCGTVFFQQLYHFTFLCHPLPNIQPIIPPSHAHEVLEMHWFPEHALPDDIDPGHIRRIPEAYRVWHGDPEAYFDRVDEKSSTL